MNRTFRPNDRARCLIGTIGLKQGWLFCVHAVSRPEENGEQFLFLNADAWNNGDGHSSTRFERIRPRSDVLSK